jgi:hypothetical protein
VAVAVGIMAGIFLPQQRQRHTAEAQLGMNMPPLQQRLRSRRVIARGREQRRIVELLRHRPGDADYGGVTHVFPDCRAADPDRSDSASTISRRASVLLCASQRKDCARLRLPTTLPASPYQRVAAFVQNRWPLSIGLGGRFHRNRMPRIPQHEVPDDVGQPSDRLQNDFFRMQCGHRQVRIMRTHGF